jgi:hypothetical protein
VVAILSEEQNHSVTSVPRYKIKACEAVDAGDEFNIIAKLHENLTITKLFFFLIRRKFFRPYIVNHTFPASRSIGRDNEMYED